MVLRTGQHRASAPPWTITNAQNAWTANQTLNDNVSLGFGTNDGESTIKSNGTDTIWQFASGGLTVGLGASAPAPDQDGVHIWKATAGAVTAIAGTLLTLENGGDSFIQLLSPNTNKTGVYYGDVSLNSAGYFLYDHVNTRFTLGIEGSDRLFYSAGAFAFQENTVISSVSGVAFPATQAASADANTLDDYEEGTWTPVLTFATAGDLSVVYDHQVGRYVKIGRKVFLTVEVDATTFTHTTASGNLRITGIPFTPVTLTNYRSQGALAFTGITKANFTNYTLQLLSNDANMTVMASGSGQTWSNVAAADMPTGTEKIISGTIVYEV